jgi:hypothetical protein
MRRWYYQGLIARVLIGLACLVPAGCADQRSSITPAQSLALLPTGRPVLSCREACLAEWQRAQPQAAQLDAGRRSQELAALVMRIGYQDDLSLYYLGRAAEGMGYRAAAQSYYRQSTQLSGTSISCQYLSRQCGGVALPQAALSRVAAIERMFNSPRPRRPGPALQRSGAPGVPEAPEALGAPEALEAAPGEVAEPPPSPVPPPAPPLAARPVPHPAGPAPFEYIEPPPAAR